MKARLKTFAAYAIPVILVWAILSAAESIGYYRGFKAGQNAEFIHVMCLLERTADLQPKYCQKAMAQ